MSILKRKLKTLLRGIRTRGFFGFFRHLLFETDNIYVGALAVLSGNQVRIDGNAIYIDNPLIPLERKSQFIQGRFERSERTAVKRFVNPNLPVIELGGSVGVVACLTNRLLVNRRAHIVVEAHPLFVQTLAKNKAANHCEFTIVERAIGYSSSEVNIGGLDFSIRINGADGIRVATTTLQHIVQAHNIEEFTLICDIEGVETDLIRYETALLQSKAKLIIMEMHPNIVGELKTKESLIILSRIGFEPAYRVKDVYVFRKLPAIP